MVGFAAGGPQGKAVDGRSEGKDAGDRDPKWGRKGAGQQGVKAGAGRGERCWGTRRDGDHRRGGMWGAELRERRAPGT